MADNSKGPVDGVRTVAQMAEAFRSEEACRRLLEGMVWPKGSALPVLRQQTFNRAPWPGLWQEGSAGPLSVSGSAVPPAKPTLGGGC